MNKFTDYVLAYLLLLVAVSATWFVAYAMYLAWSGN